MKKVVEKVNINLLEQIIKKYNNFNLLEFIPKRDSLEETIKIISLFETSPICKNLEELYNNMLKMPTTNKESDIIKKILNGFK